MTQEIEGILEDAIRSGNFLGVSYIAVDKNGDTIYSGAHGSQNFSKTEPMAIDTAGFIASMTKLMTSVATMQIIEKGLVGLDDDLGAIVPELGNREILVSFDEATKTPTFEKPTNPITLRRLLTHSAGFTYDNYIPALRDWAIANGKDGEFFSGDFKAYVRPLVYNPGTSWAYGQNIDWAGKVVETLTKQRLGDYMEENIWSKVGISNTTFHPETRSSFPMLDMGMRANGTYSPLIPSENPFPMPANHDLGGAGLYSTAKDYSKFLAALLSDNGLLLKKESLEEFIKPHLSEASKEALMKNRINQRVQIDVPGHTPVDHCLGGIVLLEDIPGRRKKGTIHWDGMTNPSWMLDRTSGVACVLFTQILPSQDIATKELWTALEAAVYKHVNK